MRPKTVIKLVIASLIVGFILVKIGVSPKEFWTGVADAAAWAWENAVSFFKEALIYIVVGAFVVVPIWLVRRLLQRRRKQGPAPE